MRFLLLAALLIPLAAPAQTAEETFGESIDVRVVNVEAVVTDGRGERVRGLTAGDFRLLVDGVEVPVDYFTEVADGVARPAPQSGEESVPAPPAPTAAGPVGRSLLVFIDESLSIAAQRDVVLKEIERDLDRLGPEDRMAVVAFDGGRLQRLADWTSDHRTLLKAFAEARSRPAQGILTLAERRSAFGDKQLGQDDDLDFYSSEFRPYDRFEYEDVQPQQYSRLVRVVEAAAAALRSFSLPPGRKAMLVLSGGWPLTRPVARLVQDANRLGYTLYPVDVPGIDIAQTVGDVRAERPMDGPARVLTSPWEQASHHTLHLLAAATGGREAINSNRLAALERADEDTRSYYWLGFSPAWKANDRHHRVELKVRRPGLDVRARSGFSDLSPATLAEMETEGLLAFGTGDKGDKGDKGDRQPGEDHMQVEMGEPRQAGWRMVEVPVTLVLPAAIAGGTAGTAGGEDTELVLSVGSLDRFGGRSELPQIHFKVSPSGGAQVRSEVTVRLRKAEQRLVFHVRDPRTGKQLVEEVSYQPGK
ncbi:MAG TPA: VWA domain-containing protein [Thermoanaerobaculia bacterium]|jgi:VWFA-related protein|nr:VWA domain-containing protein [Thermoanaerobaculia bacterium]